MLRRRLPLLLLCCLLGAGAGYWSAGAGYWLSRQQTNAVRNAVLGAILGALLGLLLGLALAFLLERSSRRIRKPWDLEEVYGLPLLGVVPRSRAIAGSRRRRGWRRGGPLPPLPASEAEVFALIRVQLRYLNPDRELRTLLIVSPTPGDGKSTVARQLAAAAARAGSSVLLLEADLRQPTLARRLELDSAPGLRQVLARSVSLWKATQAIYLDGPSGALGPAQALDVLVAGDPLPLDPGRLIEGDALSSVLEQASSTYDLVVIDTPPLTAVSDAFPLLGMVDGVIILGRIDRDRREVARRLHKTLAAGRAPLVGVIANGLRVTRGSYGYAYGPGYRYRPAKAGRRTAAGQANAVEEAAAVGERAAGERQTAAVEQATVERRPAVPVEAAAAIGRAVAAQAVVGAGKRAPTVPASSFNGASPSHHGARANGKEADGDRDAPTLAGRVRHASAPILLLAAILALVSYRSASILSAKEPRTDPWPIARSPVARIDVGVTTSPLARNVWRAWGPGDLQSVDAFEHAARRHVSVVMWYADWRRNSPLLAQLNAVARRGSVPEITWEPWDATRGTYSRQPDYTLQSIIDGSHDGYIRSWARALAGYGKPVRMRFAQEMNGNWYPWGESASGNRPGQFVRAWRHVHDLFRAAGAVNVRWVWSPVAIADSISTEQYPGDRYVDRVGLSLFNGGAQLKFQPWRSFAAKIARPLDALRRIAPRKPIELSEVGVAEQGGSKARWISGMFHALKGNPQITSVVWFDLQTSSDWRVESSLSAQAAFAAGVSDPRYR